MTYYRGIDLHSTNSVVVVTDGADRVVFKGRLANELRTVADTLAVPPIYFIRAAGTDFGEKDYGRG